MRKREKRIQKKSEKGQATTATLQIKVKVEKEVRIERVLYKEKRKVDKKTMLQTGKVTYKNKQAKHL